MAPTRKRSQSSTKSSATPPPTPAATEDGGAGTAPADVVHPSPADSETPENAGIVEATATPELHRIFSNMADGLQLLGENQFKVAAYERVARMLGEGAVDPVAAVAEARAAKADPVKRLSDIEGIGKGTAEKIIEFLDSGRVQEHDELMSKIPQGLFDIMQIPGLGPKTVRALWNELKITSIAKLKAAIHDGSILTVPRMGKKTVENIQQALEFMETSAGRHPLGIIQPVAEIIVERIRKVPGVTNARFAGSLRRGRDTIGDIDVLATAREPEAVRDVFVSMPEVTQVLAKGETKSSVRFDFAGVTGQADLRMVDEAAWGAALLYFTGSKDHNVRLRELAIRRNLRLNEYGLFEGLNERPQDRGEKPLAARTEEDIYRALDLPYIPPELREDRGELDLRETPRLIEAGDIRSELHAHTTESDGKWTLEQLVEAAKSRGCHTLAVTDHSVSSFVANGLNVKRLRAQGEAIRALNGRVKGITVLAGSEVDILADGRLDYDDDVLAELDVVVASPHVALRQDPATATKRLLRAIENPFVHILGHPTGRIINERNGLEPDLNEIFAAAREHNVAVEINCHWKRLDLRDTHARLALEHGCLIAIDTDAHSPDHFENLRYGVVTARRAGVTPEVCINTWDAARLHAWLRKNRA